MLSQLCTHHILRMIPGRLRIVVNGLKKEKRFAVYLTDKLQQTTGINSAYANALTGRVLVSYTVGKISVQEIQRQIQSSCKQFVNLAPPCRKLHFWREPASEPGAGVQLANAAVTGGILGWLAVKRLTGTRPLRAAPEQLFNAAAITTIIAGYPFLRKGLGQLIRHKRLGNDLLLPAASLILLVMRESVPGLSVLWLVQLSGLFQHFMRIRSREIERDLINCKKANAPLFGDPANDANLQIPAQVPPGVRNDLPGQDNDIDTGKLVWWTMGIAALVFLFTRDYRRSMAVLLAGCPAAAALSAGSAYGMAAAQAARQGVLIRDDRSIRTASQIGTVIFENNEIVAGQKPEIFDVISLSDNVEPENILALAAALEKTADHPVARMLIEAAASRGIVTGAAVNRQLLGQGVKGIVEDSEVMVGSEQWLNNQSVATHQTKARAARLKHLGCSVLYVAVNRTVVGLIGVKEQLRMENRRALEAIRATGITDIRVFSGTHCSNQNIGRLGLTEIKSCSSPEDKRGTVLQLQQAGKRVAVIGKGREGMLAMSSADLGISMGTAGSVPAVQAADMVICGDKLQQVPEVLELSRKTVQVVRQNLVFSAGASVIGIALAAANLFSPWSASMLLNISTLGVILNSARLLKRLRKEKLQTEPPDMPRINLQQFSQTASAARAAFSRHHAVVPPHFEQPGLCQDGRGISWHALSAEAVCARLDSSLHFGLNEQNARKRSGLHGLNCLVEAPRAPFWKLFHEQFKDFMVRVLLGATGLSFLLGEVRDAMLTAAIVVANALLGTYQESKAEQSLDSVRKMADPLAKVLREGRVQYIKAEYLVPGDLILLEAGDRIPADARLTKTSQFEVEEASLTGENLPAQKSSKQVETETTALGDRRNMVFMGTIVTRGRAQAIVVATGMGTELGKIAALLQGRKSEQTPLQKRLEELGRTIVLGCLAIAGIIFATGILSGQNILSMVRCSATIAVTAIPEGLSAIVVVALALGVRRMVKQNILVRNMAAIETLGCATVICSDKTGTLTKNEMTVRKIYTVGNMWTVSGEGYAVRGNYLLNGVIADPAADGALMQALLAGALCNNAKLNRTAQPCRGQRSGKQAGKGRVIDGDPTEGALLVAAAKAGLWEEKLALSYVRDHELPFASERRMMSVVCSGHDKIKTLYCKGAPDSILDVCTHYLAGSEVLPMTGSVRRKLQETAGRMAGEALRVLATACRRLEGDETEEDLESRLVFCGLAGMIDPPRPEVPSAIARCRQAGVKVVMITGDHPNTAQAIARELGLLEGNGRVLAGRELDRMTDEQLASVVEAVRVYARTTPQHKLRIIKAFKQKGYVVAMTGDGANDAPAVKAADVGIAMGATGTAVTKEAAGLTLADDNFATIVKAMQEGRCIYANIRKAIRYALATNIGEVVLMFFAALLALPLPLLPIQLLWINLIGDGLPVIALVNDPPAKGIMRQPPRSANDSVFSGGIGGKIISRGIIIGTTALALYAWKLFAGAGLGMARTLAFAQIVVSQFVHIFDCRTEERTGKTSLFSNWALVGSVALSMIMAAGVIYIAPLQRIFCTTALTAGDWLLVGAASAGTALLDAGAGRIMKRLSFAAGKDTCMAEPAT